MPVRGGGEQVILSPSILTGPFSLIFPKNHHHPSHPYHHLRENNPG
jgi:hypothetical protein